MTNASRNLRRIELALWAIGISLIGGVLGATYDRWSYQVEQERALLQTLTTGSPQAALDQPAVQPVSVERPIGPAAFVGPVRPSDPKATLEVARDTETPPVTPPTRTARIDPSVFGRIEIPRIGLKAIIREGADEKTLKRAVGLVPNAPLPGRDGNTVLAAHRDTFFWPLKDIELNDRIRLRAANDEVYEYRVDEVRIVEPEETDVLQSRGVEELTLVTCYPFRFIGPAPDRFIVKATRVN